MPEAAISIPAGAWAADPGHSRVGFAVKHLGIATVRGHFGEFAGTLELGDNLESARITGTVKTASVDTNEADRDAHLRSPEFFDSEAHPEMSFESKSIAAKDEDTFIVRGDLTIRGVTNEVELEAELDGTETDPWGNSRVGLEITGEISRGDFGMKFNQALGSGNVLVADKVKLHLDVSAVKQG
ncbi:MAG: YceI family protein [Actinomycetes bacterium]